MKLIPLSQGLFAQVDDSDYEWLMQWKWCATGNQKKGFYAVRFERGNRKHRKQIAMHRQILQTDAPSVDHKDHNRLNNQRHNIRPATHRQNQANLRPYGGRKYKGVSIHRRGFKASISDGRGGAIWIGKFNTPEEAAAAYDKKAFEIHGEFAHLNFPHLLNHNPPKE